MRYSVKDMKKGKKNKWSGSILKRGLLVLVCGVFIWLAVVGIRSFLNNASYFRVKKVTFIGLNEKKIVEKISKKLMYDNIFGFDIVKIAQNLKREYPQFYDVEVVRNLPDELVVKVARRKPRAQIKQKSFFLVDSEGVIVSDASERPFDDYIVIVGIEGISGLSFGKKVHSAELTSGLKLAEMLSERRDHLISLMPEFIYDTRIRIDVILYPSLYVYFDTLELRFHSDSFHKQFNSLFGVLPSLSKKIKEVKYIDLRFGDPAVSF